MEKAVLISIRPNLVQKIIDGEKTVEIRKTRPKIEPPFKCYIYNTAGDWSYQRDHWYTAVVTPNEKVYDGSQRVIGEFVCDEIKTYLSDDFVGAEDFNGTIREKPIDGDYGYWIPNQDQTCLTYCEILKYGAGKTLYGWHISNLVVYDKPKELREFHHLCPQPNTDTCYGCKYLEPRTTDSRYLSYMCRLKRPPMSWCYVEEMKQ